MPAETSASQWFAYGDRDLHSASILMRHEGPPEHVLFFLQQATEKYLKGFLVSKGWKLKRIHDLEVLITEANRHEKTLKPYLDFARMLSAAYVESRYPSRPPKDYTSAKLNELLEQTQDLIARLKKATSYNT